MPTYCEKISQIQIGGLQPCDDLTWNDPKPSLLPHQDQVSELTIL